jgi:hypothetical protein
MHADTAVALASIGVAATVAVCVPWLTFRYALRQDGARWLREQRAALYADLLAEAHAEQDYLDYALADDETREAMREHFATTDTRMPSRDRAQLGARGTIFASRDVNRLFNQMAGVGGRALLQRRTEALRIGTRVEVATIMDKLEAQVRRELGADRISLPGG